MSILLGLLNRENPESAIIFTNTKHMAHEISKRLEHNGYKNEYLMGDIPQKKRLRIINNVKEGKIKFLVATDVAARGLHVDDLALVINYDLPLDTENYVHRIGRTARAGKNGKAITLACENYVYSLSGIEDYIETKIPVFPTTEELFVEDTSAHLRFSLNEHKNRNSRNRDNRGGDRNRDYKERGKNKDSRERNRNNYNNKRQSSETDNERLKRVRSRVMNVSGANSLDADFEKDKKYQPKKQSNKNRTVKSNKKRNDKRYDSTKKVAMEGVKRVSSDSKVEDRLAYYKKKYGEDFKPSESMLKPKKKTVTKFAPKKTAVNKTSVKKEKIGLFGKIGKIFKK